MSSSVVRDDWMKRTGPFYPLLVAFRLQSRLPVATRLEPTAEDFERSSPWLIAVGAAVGIGLALASTLLSWSPLVPAISASLLVALWVFASGAYAERGVAKGVLGSFGGAADIGSGHLLAVVLLRLGLLLGTSPAAWAAAFVTSAVAGKLAWLVSTRPPWEISLAAGDEKLEPLAAGLTAPRWGIAGLAALLAVIAFAGVWAVAVLVTALACGWVARRFGISKATLVGAVELVALVAVAIAAPAMVSPLVSP